MLQLRFKLCREAVDQALAMASIWKVCDCQKYIELVDTLLAQIAQRTHALYKIIASKELTSSIIVVAQASVRHWKAGTATET